jgi:hypothetical protein
MVRSTVESSAYKWYGVTYLSQGRDIP